MTDVSESTAEAATVVEPTKPSSRNEWAFAANVIGIIGLVLVAGVLALLANALVIALTTPDFMPSDASDDPFVGTGVACVLPLILGFVGLGFGIRGRLAVPVSGQRASAIRGFVLALVNIVLPIALIVLVANFDAGVAACGGG